MHDGFTPFQSRHMKDFDGPLIPFGAYVKFKPTTPEDLRNMKEFGDKDLDGIFLGYCELKGGHWDGALKVASWEREVVSKY